MWPKKIYTKWFFRGTNIPLCQKFVHQIENEKKIWKIFITAKSENRSGLDVVGVIGKSILYHFFIVADINQDEERIKFMIWSCAIKNAFPRRC